MKNLKLKIQNSKLSVLAGGLFTHPLFSGSAVMIVGSNLTNFIAYVYHLIIGRILGPSPYGELAATISLIGLFSTAFMFLSLVIVKFVSAAKRSEVQVLFAWFTKKAFMIGAIIALLAFLSTPFLSRFLHIKYSVITLVGPILFFFFVTMIYRAFLQGLFRFKELVISANLEMLGRLAFGIALTLLGYSVAGAVFGLFLSAILGFLLTVYFLREFRSKKDKTVFKGGNKVLSYTIPIFLVSIATNSLYSIDLILVKHFFAPHDAGLYASLSTLGKVIFFGAAPVASVMFPMISKRHAQGKGIRQIFLLSFALTAAISVGVLFVYWLLPELAIRVLFGEQFLQASPNLVWFGVFMTLFTLSSLVVNYYLSREKTGVSSLVVLAAIGQAVSIWLFHDSIFTVIKVSIVSVSFLLTSLIVYFAYESKKEPRKV